jgi:4-amino-4-deoxy-L-arabinose transferase-like glycosyltransferase
MYLIAKTLFGKKTANLALAFAVIIMGFSPYLAYPYSDTFSMPFITSSLYYIIRATRSQDYRKKLLWSILAGLTLAMGWLVKPFIVTIIVALFMVLWLALFKRGLKGVAPSIMLVLIGIFTFSLFIGGFNIFLNKQKITYYDEREKVPFSYTVAYHMANIDNDLQSDLLEKVISSQFDRNTDEICKEVIREQFKKLGIGGYLKGAVRNFEFIFKSGGSFLRLSVFDTRQWYKYIADPAWIIISFGTLCGMFFIKKSVELIDLKLLLKLLPIGIFLVQMFVTECQASYIIGHLPFFCIIAAHGFLKCLDMKKSRVLSLQHGKYKECKKTNPCDCEEDRI